jgi:hypothetical protein
MPRTEVVIYKEKNNGVPLLRWMDSLPRKLRYKWTTRFDVLEENGYDLRRPICDILRDKIYELRVKWKGVNYRVLYSFIGQNIVLLTHGCSKIDKVPEKEIDKAIERRQNYLSDPEAHTYIEE